MNADFQLLKDFNFTDAVPYLWVFKESDSPAKFRTYYVQTEVELNQQIKLFVQPEIVRITEFTPYSYISQTNENSCLSIDSQAIDFSSLKVLVDRLEPEHRINDKSILKGVTGYVVKFILNDVTVYGVKRSTSTWKTSYSKKFINMSFINGELSGVEDNNFTIEKNFDFYVINNSVFIVNKRGFESIMKYRTAYIQAFEQLIQIPEFTCLFSDLTPILNYVGSNSIQLRRMGVIEEKAIFNNPNFMDNLIRVNNTRGWGINFDTENNTIIPCENTTGAILKVLLDHRLMSEITNNIYDVQDTVRI